MPFDPSSFSEIVRTLSPSRFRRFMEGAIDIERKQEYQREEITSSLEFGLSKKELGPPELQRSLLQYVNHAVSGWGYVRQQVSSFILVHHVPSLISDLDFAEILRADLKRLIHSPGYKELIELSHNVYGDVAYYYGTNKDFTQRWKKDAEGWTDLLGAIREETQVPFSFNCIDPYTVGTSLDSFPENETILLDTLSQPDGLSIETTAAGINIRPFIACDVLPLSADQNSYVFNVDATPLATSRLSSLQGLEDILTLTLDERRIEAFLIAHPDILLGLDYLSFRTQLTIAPTGERPDFFLERVDGFWEALELKRPEPALFIEGQAGCVDIARYLEASLKQCVKYLRLLERRDVRRRLLDFGVRIEEPRVTLLAGRQQYPGAVVDLIHSTYDNRIVLRSFEELLEDSKQRAAGLLSQMKNLALSRTQAD